MPVRIIYPNWVQKIFGVGGRVWEGAGGSAGGGGVPRGCEGGGGSGTSERLGMRPGYAA